jgi:hypothetical protein
VPWNKSREEAKRSTTLIWPSRAIPRLIHRVLRGFSCVEVEETAKPSRDGGYGRTGDRRRKGKGSGCPTPGTCARSGIFDRLIDDARTGRPIWAFWRASSSPSRAAWSAPRSRRGPSTKGWPPPASRGSTPQRAPAALARLPRRSPRGAHRVRPVGCPARQDPRPQEEHAMSLDYLSHFGLSAEPFSKDIGDAELWLPNTHPGRNPISGRTTVAPALHGARRHPSPRCHLIFPRSHADRPEPTRRGPTTRPGRAAQNQADPGARLQCGDLLSAATARRDPSTATRCVAAPDTGNAVVESSWRAPCSYPDASRLTRHHLYFGRVAVLS